MNMTLYVNELDDKDPPYELIHQGQGSSKAQVIRRV
jgi:hypothetical protein